MSYRWLQDSLNEALIDALADRDDELGDELAERETFTCAHCRETFPKAWTEEERDAEAIDNGFDLASDNVIVCDDCYLKIMAYNVPGWRP